MNLIYDRTAEDVERALALAKKAEAGTLTDAEKAEWLAGMKGCYNVADMNRVEAAVQTLAAELNAAGYPVEVEPVLKGGSRLPAGYTEVASIEGTGSQYIDTGVSPTASTKFQFAVTMKALTGYVIIGDMTNDENDYRIFNYQGAVYWDMGSSRLIAAANSLPVGERAEFEVGNNYVKKNGIMLVSGGTLTALSIPQTIHVFGTGQGTCKAVIEYLTIWDGDAKVRDFVPCKNPDGAVGLYDLIGGEFYTTPTAAGAVALPTGYTQVEYIQSSGTQYIDTGFKPDQNTMIEADIAYLGTAGDNIAGVRNSSSDAINRFGLITFGSAKKIGAFFRDSSIQAITLDNKKHKYNLSKNGLYVDFILYGSSNSGSFACSYNYILFGFNNGSNGIVYTKSRVYACKIYNSGTLVRNLIPAKNSSGTIGLYDLVNNAFYTNAGSGTFTAGADIAGFTAGAEISALEDREWRESDIVRLSQWKQYLANVQALRDAYYTLAETGQLPDAEDRLDYIGANTVEKILADIDLLIGWMKSSYRRCGTFRAGNNAAHLPLKGSA